MATEQGSQENAAASMAAGLAAGIALSFVLPGIGFAVGWMIGSWAYQAFGTKPKKDSTKPADEPQVSNAQRGIIIPHVFGRVRISSNVVWKHNFQAEKIGGGGKKGGGGKGGKKGGGSKQSHYEYFSDLIYHMAVVHEPYVPLAGWVSTTPISSFTIGLFTLSSGDEWSPISSGGIEVIDTVPDSDEDDPNAASVLSPTFSSSFFYQGHTTEDDVGGWDYFDTQEAGHGVLAQPNGVKWPNTVWMGFHKLKIGEQAPAIPNINMEISPVEGAEVEADVGALIYTAAHAESLSGGLDNMRISGVDVFGQGYFMRGGRDTMKVTCIDKNGTPIFSWDIDDAVAAVPDGLVKILGDSAPGGLLDYSPTDWCVVSTTIPAKSYLIGFFPGYSDSDESSLCSAIVFQCRRGEEPFYYGYARMKTGPLGMFHIVDTIQFAQPINFKTSADPIVIGQAIELLVPRRWAMFVLPSIDEMKDSIQELLADRTYTDFYQLPAQNGQTFAQVNEFFGLHTGSIGEFTTFNSSGFVVPLLDGDDIRNFLYFYLSRGWMAHASSNPWTANYAATQWPTGVMLRIELPIGMQPSYYGRSSSTPAASLAVLDSFTDDSLTWGTPWTEEFVNINNEIASEHSYRMKPSLFQLIGTRVYIGFLMTGLSDDETAIEWHTVPGRLKVFMADVLNVDSVSDGPTITEVGTLKLQLYDYSSWGLASPPLNGYADNQDVPIFYDATRGKLIALGRISGEQGETSIQTYEYALEIANLFDGRANLTPPEIIKEVMTNVHFGVRPGLAIDNASYTAAVSYCETEGIKVAAIYNQPSSVFDILSMLLALYNGSLRMSGGILYFDFVATGADETPVRTLDNDHLLITEEGEPPVSITRQAIQDTYNQVRVNYYDRRLQYRQNSVVVNDEPDQDRRGIVAREFPATFVMDEELANKLALRTLYGNLYARQVFNFRLGFKDSDLEPGDLITLVDSFSRDPSGSHLNEDARIVRWVDKGNMFEVTAVQDISYVASADLAPAESTIINSFSFGSKDVPLSTVVYELPREFADDPEVYLSYMPNGMPKGANVYISNDGVTYNFESNIEPFPLAGMLITGLPSTERFADNVEIYLYPNSGVTASNTPTTSNTATLFDITAAGRRDYQSLLWCGSEMLSWENATLVAQNRYLLERVYRGVGGTNIHAHSPGEYFYGHDAERISIPYGTDEIGVRRFYKVCPYDFFGAEVSISSVAAIQHVIEGRWYAPRIPPHLTLALGSLGANSFIPDGRYVVPASHPFANVTIGWGDAANLDNYGAGGYGNIPYGQSLVDVNSQRWLVNVVGSGSLLVSSFTTTTPSYHYTGSQNIAHNGAFHPYPSFNVTAYNDRGVAPRTQVRTLELA